MRSRPMLLTIIEGGPEPNGAGDVRRACLELGGQVGVGRLFEGDGLDHLAAALVRRHPLEQGFLAVEDADTGRAEELVPGEGIEVAVQLLYVDGEVRHGLGAVEDGRARGERSPSR